LADTAGGTADLATGGEALAAEQIRLVAQQSLRAFVSVVCLDAFLVWLLEREGLLAVALVWIVVGTSLQLLRLRLARQYERGTASPKLATIRLAILFGVIGVARAAIIPFLFAHPVSTTHYVLTMVLLGQMAGATGTVGGIVGAFVAWAAPITLAAAAAWALQGSFDGRWIAVLLVLLFVVLAGYVRANRATLAALIESSHNLRRERDRAHSIGRRNEELAESLRLERDRAEDVSRSKTRFFAAASHDLRQPLHALSINATTLELLARRGSEPMIKELSQSINRALAQSNGLLEGLLDISRLDAGDVAPEWEAVDVTALLRAVTEEFLMSAARQGLELRLDLDPVGAEPARAWIRSDGELLLRILNNLVSNSLKFTTAGTIRLFARVEAGDDASVARQLSFGVEDSGCGIADTEQEKVFEEFYQVDNPSRDRSLGLGLGLSIVRRSAQLLGLPLELRSGRGEGTRVTLRAALVDGPVTAAPAQPGESCAARIAALALKVLVIDDEHDIVESVRHLLTVLGCAVQAAGSSADAVGHIAAGFTPDVLLVDFRLRNETGLQAIDRLLLLAPGAVALLVTGDTSPHHLQALGQSGIRVIHKPVDGLRLAEAILDTLTEARRAPQTA